MTSLHAKYYAHFLSLQQPSHGVQRLGNSLLNATIDLNPHQVDGALFFFDNPLNRGVMLADEVWLGKTIEAWLVLCQLRSERKRKILLVVPASLRKQWVAELHEKFHLPAKIVDWPIYRKSIDTTRENPFREEAIIVTSYAFAASENNDKYTTWDDIESINWDLVVFDEAHKLRNIYKDLESDLDDFIEKDKDTVKKKSTAKKLFDRFEYTKKLLLTATPLQNSLLELFGLMNFIDPYSFADLESFKEQYNPQIVTPNDLAILRKRIQPYFHRTLRKQVAADINYTKRRPLTQEYQRSTEEQLFYEQVSEFLRTSSLFQNKNGQVNYLVILLYRKLLASSIPAVLWTLKWLAKRVEAEMREIQDGQRSPSAWQDEVVDDQDIIALYKEDAEDQDIDIESVFQDDIDTAWIEWLKANLKQIQAIISLWENIQEDNKIQSLLDAIQTSYEQLDQLGAKKKVLIFTESRRTQDYLYAFLEKNWYAGKVVCFNGDNNSPMVKKIYNDWKVTYQHTSYFSWSVSSDTRAAIVDYFKSTAEIMIATESASEWVNLQFCSLVINYDLPWNPQRVEQRIGRCHRYGQEHDVIVMNFINTKNRADERVFELLNQKFSLFQGLFGASDDILGALESGIDIERTILDIYQTCRTKEEIDTAFDKLQEDMAVAVASKMEETKEKVLNRLDEDVARRLKDKKEQSQLLLGKMQERLIKLIKIVCVDSIEDISSHAFRLTLSPTPGIASWIYTLDPKKTPGYLLRSTDALGHYSIQQALSQDIPHSQVVFNLSWHDTRISILEELRGKSWYMKVSVLSIDAYAKEEYLIHSGMLDNGIILDEEVLEKLMSLAWQQSDTTIDTTISDTLNKREKQLASVIKQESEHVNQEYFVMEMDKLDHWANDLKISLEKQKKSIKTEISTLRRDYRIAEQLEEKVALQRKIRKLEQKESKLRKEINELEDQIDNKKELLIDEIEKRLDAQSQIQDLFVVRWSVV